MKIEIKGLGTLTTGKDDTVEKGKNFFVIIRNGQAVARLNRKFAKEKK
jgi:hypothetical protein